MLHLSLPLCPVLPTASLVLLSSDIQRQPRVDRKALRHSERKDFVLVISDNPLFLVCDFLLMHIRYIGFLHAKHLQ